MKPPAPVTVEVASYQLLEARVITLFQIAPILCSNCAQFISLLPSLLVWIPRTCIPKYGVPVHTLDGSTRIAGTLQSAIAGTGNPIRRSVYGVPAPLQLFLLRQKVKNRMSKDYSTGMRTATPWK